MFSLDTDHVVISQQLASVTVLARNLVDFDRVPGLQVEDWTTL